MYFIFFLLFVVCNNVLAKDRRGDPFRTSYESTFLRSGSIHHLNSLHVMASPLAEEPFSLLSQKVSFDHLNDNVTKLLEIFTPYLKVSTINELDKLRLLIGRTLVDVWSYHAFPMATGGLAKRFIDPTNLTWEELFYQYSLHPADEFVRSDRIADLSPLEKYELLTGIDFTLSKAEWVQGQRYQDLYHEVPYWIGVCHGTAPASYSHVRPLKSISMRSPVNDEIIFYPSDIKALLSFAWSMSGGASAIMGRRCGDIIRPNVRPSSSCQDTNPSSFHLAITNLIGIQGRPIIMDASAGSEVWNRTIIGYSYRYFKPGPRNITTDISRAIVSRNEFANDPYAPYRSSRSTHLIGIEMKLTYVVGTLPSTQVINSAVDDELETMILPYHLELDHSGEIVGGEWLQHSHPDFLWVVASDYRPQSIQDHLIGDKLNSFDGKTPLFGEIFQYARDAASSGEVLFSVIDRMLQLSQ